MPSGLLAPEPPRRSGSMLSPMSDSSAQDVNAGALSRSSRNSLLELYRFLFALWVAYYHGFLVALPSSESPFAIGVVSVEFFFVLSGFFLPRTFAKLEDRPFFPAAGALVGKLFKSIAVPFFIGWFCVLWTVLFLTPRPLPRTPVAWIGYLWYVPYLAAAEIVLMGLRRILKSKVLYAAALLVLVAADTVAYARSYPNLFGPLRALGGVSLGILIAPGMWGRRHGGETAAKTPKRILLTALTFVFGLVIAWIPGESLVRMGILGLVVYPLLIRLSYGIPVHIPLFNLLGKLSFGLYAFQCTTRLLVVYKFHRQGALCFLLFLLTLLEQKEAVMAFFRRPPRGKAPSGTGRIKNGSAERP